MKSKLFFGFLIFLFLIFVSFLLYYHYQSNPSSLGINSKHFYSPGNVPAALLSRELALQTQTLWATGTHTATPVPIGIIGPAVYTEQLKGIVPNTRIFEVLSQAITDSMNVILVIGDGMGVSQMSLPIFRNISKGNRDTTYFEKISRQGGLALSLTAPMDEFVTCSAAGATAIACGAQTLTGMVGMDANGNPRESLLEIADKNGKATGLVSDVRLTDATCAAFYGKTVSRYAEDTLASLLAGAGIDVLFGGGATYFIPESTSVSDHPLLHGIHASLNGISSRSDKRDLIREMIAQNYSLLTQTSDLENPLDTGLKYLGLFSGDALHATIDRDDDSKNEPTVPHMTARALERLSADSTGFFLMAECGRIDWESHRNDVGAVLAAMTEMDAVLGVGYSYYLQNPQKTVLLFTADHETGGMALCYTHENLPENRLLANGQTWKPAINGISHGSFLNHEKQKRTFESMLAASKTAEDLIDQVKRNTAYTLSPQQAAEIITHK